MSRIILYMAITPNGLIAKENDDTAWISADEWNSYSAAVRKAGCLVIGHRTYDILTKQVEFAELEKVTIVVVSKTNFKTLAPKHLVVENNKGALEMLSDFEEVIVAGGGILNSSFVKEGLIDEIYLDIEPVIFGRGVKLFKDEDFEVKLKLVGVKKITDDVIQLHYEVRNRDK